MRKIIFLMSVLLVWATSISAENITREKADAIVKSYVESGVTQPAVLFTNLNEPNEAGIAITTSNEEALRAKYACWAYCFDEIDPVQRRYFFVKEENGSLLEVIASNDFSELDASWMAMDVPAGLAASKRNNCKQLYPNPVSDLLSIPCNGENVSVEIYDIKGARLFSGLLSGEDTCQLNVSFLSVGVYMVNVSGKTYKLIKN